MRRVTRQEHLATLLEPFARIWRHRALIHQLVRRDVIGRYRGSLLGVAWSFFNPLIMLLVYTFVFAVVFQARWSLPANATHANFAVIVFVGMIIHGLFSEVATRAPGIVLANVSYVKRIVFPLEVLPVVLMGSALFHATVSLAVLLLAQLLLAHSLPWTALLLPLVLAPLVLGILGVAWFLAAIGVYVRDVGQTIGIVTAAMLFLAPVFYPITALPASYRILLHLNPLTFVIEAGRQVLFLGELPRWDGWLLYLALNLGVATAGYQWFQKTRKGFADVV